MNRKCPNCRTELVLSEKQDLSFAEDEADGTRHIFDLRPQYLYCVTCDHVEAVPLDGHAPKARRRRTPMAAETLRTLRAAKRFYGRRWRAAVYRAWIDGDYRGIAHEIASALQRLRNDPGRTWNPATVRI